MKFAYLLLGVAATKNAVGSETNAGTVTKAVVSEGSHALHEECDKDHENKGCDSGLRCMKFEVSEGFTKLGTMQEYKIPVEKDDDLSKERKRLERKASYDEAVKQFKDLLIKAAAAKWTCEPEVICNKKC